MGPIPPHATLMFDLELLEASCFLPFESKSTRWELIQVGRGCLIRLLVMSGGSFISMMALGGLLVVGLLGFLLVWLTGTKGLPAGPLLPLANVVHAKGNPHVFFDLEAVNPAPRVACRGKRTALGAH